MRHIRKEKECHILWHYAEGAESPWRRGIAPDSTFLDTVAAASVIADEAAPGRPRRTAVHACFPCLNKWRGGGSAGRLASGAATASVGASLLLAQRASLSSTGPQARRSDPVECTREHASSPQPFCALQCTPGSASSARSLRADPNATPHERARRGVVAHGSGGALVRFTRCRVCLKVDRTVNQSMPHVLRITEATTSSPGLRSARTRLCRDRMQTPTATQRSWLR